MKSETITTQENNLVNKIQIFFTTLLAIIFFNFENRLLAQVEEKKTTLNDLIDKAKKDAVSMRLQQTVKSKTNVSVENQIFSSVTEADLSKIKPPRTSMIYSVANKEEADYEKTLNLQISELYKMTEKYRTSANRGELWLRLGELYVEKAVIIENRKQLEYDQKLSQYLAGGQKQKPTLDLTEARGFNKNAIQLYTWYIKDFPKENKTPQALYFLGYNNFELGLYDEGVKYYSELITKYKKSAYTDDAYFALAEHDFEKENWTGAYRNYSAIIKNKNPELYYISLYKAAWCLYRIGQTVKAVEYLDFIVKNNQKLSEQSSKSGLKVDVSRLENDAVKDLALFFSDLNDVDRAMQYFQNLQNKHAVESLERYANYLSNNGNYHGARKVYKFLINRSPNDKKAFDLQQKIVQNYFFSKNTQEFKKELYFWLKNYNTNSAWYLYNKSDINLVSQSIEKREETLRKFILLQHQNAQKTLSKEATNLAYDGYRLYFEEFSGSKVNTAEMRFFYGELLYDLKKYNEAAEQYLFSANITKNNPYAEKSLMNALISLEKVIPNEEQMQKKSNESKSILLGNKTLQQFIQASELYLKRFPDAVNSAEVRFRVARIYFLYGSLKNAENMFYEIIELYPNSKFADHSMSLIIDIYTQNKDYDGLIKISENFLQNKRISESSQGKVLRDIIEKAIFKKAQDLELNKKIFESAEEFKNFAEKYTSSELTATANFNAAVNYEKSGKLQLALSCYKKVLDSKQSTQILKNESQRLLVKIYEQIGAFGEASEIYSALANSNTSESLRASFTYNAAYMFELVAEYQQSIFYYEKYLKLEKNKNEISKTLFKLADQYYKIKNLNFALSYFKKYLEHPEGEIKFKVEALFHIYEISKALKLPTNLELTIKQIKNLSSSLNDSQKKQSQVFLAKLELYSAKVLYFTLKNIKIPSKTELQQGSINKKLETLNKLTEKLTEIVKYDSAEEIIDALYLLGISNFQVGQSLSVVPVPEKLSGNAKKQYLDEIRKIIQPFYIKADESFVSTIAKGRSLRVYTKSFFDAYAYLSQRYPAQYYYPLVNMNYDPLLSSGEME